MSVAAVERLDMTTPSAKRSAYQMLAQQLTALLSGERDWLANLAQFGALIFEALPHLNWAGFYMARDGQLVLGPFQGKVACVRIAFDQGVCGAAARSGQVQIVADVYDFEGHIACDSASRSELVVPVFVAGQLRAVFDLDSPLVARFDEDDASGIKRLLDVLVAATDWA
jgi:L-methionine (R)-S-oxide reductase